MVGTFFFIFILLRIIQSGIFFIGWRVKDFKVQKFAKTTFGIYQYEKYE